MRYFVISSNEDGETFISTVNPDDFLRELAQGDPFSTPFLADVREFFRADDRAPFRLVIRGDVVVPQATVKVTAYEFPPE